MLKSYRAFTLTEMLVVIAIVASLAALLFPVLARAKLASKVEASKQYLRQQYIVIELYAQNSDGAAPLWETVRNTPEMHAPCSPMDAWSQPCWTHKSPLLGSFGYVFPLAAEMTHPVTGLSED